MKAAPDIQNDLNQIIQSHYYSEDFELLSAFQAYVGTLAEEEKPALDQTVLRRLLDEGSLVDIMLCSVVSVPSAVPVLVEKLNAAPSSNQITRALIETLKNYSSDDAYMAIERFLDSDQEMDTLQALAKVDFIRTLPYLVRCMRKEHYHGIALHILFDRMKAVGLDKLLQDLRQSSATQSASFRENLLKSLRSKSAGYNPFSEEQIQDISRAFG